MSQSNATLAEVQTVAVLWSDLRQGDKITSPSGVFTVVSTHKSWDGGGSIVVEERWDRQPLNCRHDSMVSVIVAPISGGSPVAEPFALTADRPAPISAPFRIRPILKFLALPTWDRKTVARFDDFTTRHDAFELLCETMDAEAAEMMAESLEEQIRQFKRIDKLALPTFHAPHVAAPVAKVATPAVVAKVKAPTAADIFAEVLDAAHRIATDKGMPRALEYATRRFSALSAGLKRAMSRHIEARVTGYVNVHPNDAARRFGEFVRDCLVGSPVAFPEPTTAVEVETPAPKGWDAIEADDAPAPVSGGSPVATPAVEMQATGRLHTAGDWHVDRAGDAYAASFRSCRPTLISPRLDRAIDFAEAAERERRVLLAVVGSELRSIVAEILEEAREGADYLKLSARAWEAMSGREQQDFTDWCSALGYKPGEVNYGPLAADERFDVFVEECLEGTPIFPIYFPPTPPEGGHDEQTEEEAGSLGSILRHSDRGYGRRNDRASVDQGQRLREVQGRHHEGGSDAQLDESNGMRQVRARSEPLTPGYAMSRFKGGFQLVPAPSLAPLVVTFHGVGHPFHRADTLPTSTDTPSPAFRETPLSGFSDPETIEIMGVLYGLSRAPGGFDLCKADGTCYRVTTGTAAPSCECRDWKYRREGLDSRGCKHLVALRSVGLIPAQHAADTPTVEMQPTTEEVHLMASMEELGIAPICGGSDEADESLTFDEWEGADDKFAIQIEGDAMIGDHIADGDFVIIQKQREWSDGQILAIPADDGSFILRRAFRVDGGSVNLEASNEAVPAITLETIEPLGVLVGVVRKY